MKIKPIKLMGILIALAISKVHQSIKKRVKLRRIKFRIKENTSFLIVGL